MCVCARARACVFDAVSRLVGEDRVGAGLGAVPDGGRCLIGEGGQARCLMGEYRAATVGVRMLLTGSLYDSFQLSWNLGSPPPYSAAQLVYVEAFRERMACALGRLPHSTRYTFDALGGKGGGDQGAPISAFIRHPVLSSAGEEGLPAAAGDEGRPVAAVVRQGLSTAGHEGLFVAGGDDGLSTADDEGLSVAAVMRACWGHTTVESDLFWSNRVVDQSGEEGMPISVAEAVARLLDSAVENRSQPWALEACIGFNCGCRP